MRAALAASSTDMLRCMPASRPCAAPPRSHERPAARRAVGAAGAAAAAACAGSGSAAGAAAALLLRAPALAVLACSGGRDESVAARWGPGGPHRQWDQSCHSCAVH